MHKEIVVKEPSPFLFDSKLKGLCAAFCFLGLVAFLFGLKIDATRTWQAFLMAFFFFTSLSLVSVAFLALNHLSGAMWSVNVRRVFEAFASFIPYAFVLMIPLAIFGAPELYIWLDPEVVAQDALLQHKEPYLNKGFFLVRTIIFFLGWFLFSKKIIGNSVKQDATGDEKLLSGLIPYSVGYLGFFALSFSFLSVDLLMSLEPHWFSTIFGVYLFGGSFQALMAASMLVVIFLMKRGLYNGMVTVDHLHDLGKFLLGFTIFWAYIAFSQYMLIWYANMPEETIFFMHRQVGAWMWFSLSLVFLKFIVPFLLLLPRWAKRNTSYVSIICWLVLFTQFMDLYWLIYPNFDEHHLQFSFYEVFISLGMGGLFCFAVFRFLSSHSLIPMKDPRMKSSAGHTVVY